MVAQHEDRHPDVVEADPAGAADITDRITVTELPDTGFGNVVEAYSRHAFDRGHRVAVTELIASLLPATEAFLRDHTSGSPEVRETLYRFERFLAHQFDETVRADHWVSDGGGI